MSGKYYELLVLFFRTIISSFFLGIVVAFALFENFSKTSKPLQTKFVRRRTRTEDFLKVILCLFIILFIFFFLSFFLFIDSFYYYYYY